MGTFDLKRRATVWLRRYLPAELLSLTASVSASLLTLALTGNLLLAALAGTWGENLAYYGLILGRELLTGERTRGGILRTMRDLLLEFGPAELLDSLVIRPAALYSAMTFMPWPALGALVGKLMADVCFYLPTIISYELLRGRRAARESEP